MNEHMEPDYFGYIDDLRWAAGVPEIKSALENQRPASIVDAVEQWRALGAGSEITLDISAAYWLLSSLGFCRIGGVALPPDVGSVLEHNLPAQVLVGALHGLLHALEHLAYDARELPERFDDAEPIEDVALCTSIMHQLMQTWAAFIAIDKNYQEYLDAGGSPSGGFGVLMLDVLDAFDRVDEVTQGEEQLQLLSIGTELHLLENWRNMLRGPFKETLPWWLDGTLEHVAATNRRDASDKSPGLRLSDLLLLSNCDEGVPQAEDHYQLAASSGSTAEALSEQRKLLETRRRVEGDEEVGVVFWRDENARQCKEWRVELDGAPENRKQYICVEIRFSGGDVRSKPFCFDVATFELEPADWQSEITATLIDQQGERRRVLLGEYRNGGR